MMSPRPPPDSGAAGGCTQLRQGNADPAGAFLRRPAARTAGPPCITRSSWSRFGVCAPTFRVAITFHSRYPGWSIPDLGNAARAAFYPQGMLLSSGPGMEPNEAGDGARHGDDQQVYLESQHRRKYEEDSEDDQGTCAEVPKDGIHPPGQGLPVRSHEAPPPFPAATWAFACLVRRSIGGVSMYRRQFM